MSAFNNGFKYWQNINVFGRNFFSGQPSGGAIPIPPPMDFFITTELGDPILTENGQNIEVEHT